MNKLIYIAFCGSKFGGVEQKLIGQYDSLSKAISNCKMLLISNNKADENFASEINKRQNITYQFIENVQSSYKRRLHKQELILDYLKNENPQNSRLYIRYLNADPITYSLYKKIKKAGFLIYSEHQQIENPYRNLNFLPGYFKLALLDFIYGKRIRNCIEGFVCMCEDITQFESGYFRNPNLKKFITIGNGIIPTNFTPRKHTFFDGKNLSILFVGAGYRTNGLHRLIESMHKQNGITKDEVKIHVHVVGDSEEMQYNKDLIKQYDLENEFTFHGFLPFKSYEHLYDVCHIAMGTLSFSRIKTYTASILKIREYCSKGIPFFYAYDDPDFDDDFQFHHKIEANDSDFNLKPLIEFALKMNEKTESPVEMHNYAMKHLHWDVKMKKISEFIFNN